LSVKIVKIVGLAVAGVLVLAVLVLMFGVPAQPFVTYLEDEAAKAGYRLRVAGSSQISLLPYLNVSASDIRVADAKDSREELLTAKEVRAGLSLMSLISGDIRVTEIVVTQPVMRLISGRESAGVRKAPQASGSGASAVRNVAIDRISVEDGTLIMRDVRENLDGRIEAIRLTASVPVAQGPLDVKAEGRAGGQVLRLVARADSLSHIVEGRVVPVDATLEMPGLLKTPMKLAANLRAAEEIRFDTVRGTMGPERFNGSLAIDTAAARPFVNAAFSFDRLDLAPTAEASGAAKHSEPWSDRPIDLVFLRVFDCVVKLSARELSVANIRVTPAEVEANLSGGLLSLQLSRADLYGGPVEGKVVVDAGGGTPRHAAVFQFTKINGHPFLTDAVGFGHLEGSLSARFDVQATGASPQAIMSSLSGTAELTLEDGAIRDVDVPAMVRALTAQTLHGWQEKGTANTELTSLSAKFRLANGQATTDDLRLAGPLVRMTGKGTADLVAQTLDFRVDPKLVLTLQGQGGTGDPAGLGVPVVIRGAWSNPEIHPDISGILENPQAAFDQLRKMGGALFGQQGGGRRPTADEVMKSVDDLLRGRPSSGGASPGGGASGGRQPSPQDRGNQVRDFLKDLLGR
jgi:AsmA protein